MPQRFLQIHTLHSYPASLLNRDDVGFAKRLPFGGTVRARVSSQCLKRHWRTADDDNALGRIDVGGGPAPMSIRSRRTFEHEIYRPLVAEGVSEPLARAVAEGILGKLLPPGRGAGERKAKAPLGKGKVSTDLVVEQVARTDQVIVLGRPETLYLRDEARKLCAEAADPKAAAKAVEEWAKRPQRENLEALRLGAGLDAALFGRMTTGDVLARCDAAVHVAHAFTVHQGFFETDYFSALDDLQGREETGSGHINTAELSSGLFYGYVVVDLPLLVSNLEGCDRSEWETADRAVAGEVVRRLIHLIATVSPGAKLGATAPYSHAHLVLLELANAQPRTLANAFLDPVRSPLVETAYNTIAAHLQELDRLYEWQGERRLAALHPSAPLLAAAGGEQRSSSLPGIARWASERLMET